MYYLYVSDRFENIGVQIITVLELDSPSLLWFRVNWHFKWKQGEHQDTLNLSFHAFWMSGTWGKEVTGNILAAHHRRFHLCFFLAVLENFFLIPSCDERHAKLYSSWARRKEVMVGARQTFALQEHQTDAQISPSWLQDHQPTCECLCPSGPKWGPGKLLYILSEPLPDWHLHFFSRSSF